MRIIKCGLKENYITCPSCESDLAYTSEDMRRGVPKYSKSFIYCPVCNAKIEIHDEK